MQQTIADTLRTCDSIRRGLQGTQRTLEASRHRVRLSTATIDSSICRLLTAESAFGIRPAHPFYRRLVQR
jgi:hypothetical protein